MYISNDKNYIDKVNNSSLEKLGITYIEPGPVHCAAPQSGPRLDDNNNNILVIANI